MSEHQPRVGDLYTLPAEYETRFVHVAEVIEGEHGYPELCVIGDDGKAWGWSPEGSSLVLVARGARTMADRALLGEFDEKPEALTPLEQWRAEYNLEYAAHGESLEFARAFAASQGRVIAGLKAERDRLVDYIKCMALSQWAMTR